MMQALKENASRFSPQNIYSRAKDKVLHTLLTQDEIFEQLGRILVPGADIEKGWRRITTEMLTDIIENNQLSNTKFIVLKEGGMVAGKKFQQIAFEKFGLDIPLDVIKISSYGSGTVSNKEPNIKEDSTLNLDLTGMDIVLIEDLMDTGHTLKAAEEYYLSRGARSVKIIALLSKPASQEVTVANFKINNVVAVIPSKWVWGIGLDRNGTDGRDAEDIMMVEDPSLIFLFNTLLQRFKLSLNQRQLHGHNHSQQSNHSRIN